MTNNWCSHLIFQLFFYTRDIQRVTKGRVARYTRFIKVLKNIFLDTPELKQNSTETKRGLCEQSNEKGNANTNFASF